MCGRCGVVWWGWVESKYKSGVRYHTFSTCTFVLTRKFTYAFVCTCFYSSKSFIFLFFRYSQLSFTQHTFSSSTSLLLPPSNSFLLFLILSLPPLLPLLSLLGPGSARGDAGRSAPTSRTTNTVWQAIEDIRRYARQLPSHLSCLVYLFVCLFANLFSLISYY